MLDMEPVVDKWKAFGWEVKEIDGHNIREIYDALQWVKAAKAAPRIIIAHTVKGKGVSFMENNNNFHGVANTKDETLKALKELGENDAEIARILGMIK
jgi:transketolase